VAAGVCQAGFSSAWNGWIHIENLSAWHNVPIGTRPTDSGSGCILHVQRPVQVKHIQQLADWQKDKCSFTAAGPTSATPNFHPARWPCTRSSAGYAGFKSTCKFDFRTTMLPYCRT